MGLRSCNFALKWKDVPTRYKVYSIPFLNSRNSDYSPAFGNSNYTELYFTSSRKGGITDKIDNRISLATVYRTIKLFEENNVLNRIDLGGKRARYEELTDHHHDHLIDVDTGEIIEFMDEEIEELQKKVAKKLGYELVDHKMELFGKKIKRN